MGVGLGRMVGWSSSGISAALRLLVVVVLAGWMLMIRGESLVGMEPAETRCLNSLMSRGVGFGGSSSIRGESGVVEGVLRIAVDSGDESVRSWGSCSV